MLLTCIGKLAERVQYEGDVTVHSANFPFKTRIETAESLLAAGGWRPAAGGLGADPTERWRGLCVRG
jgi:hypothetical protein